MVSALAHRGPDESGLYLDPRIGLGHARLSIIGLDGGIQPLSNEDGTLWIVFNGEAFNYKELRIDLEKSGHRFSTATDTEVVLHLFEEYGPRCLERINGQFALAIWDALRGELFLARDRVGVRPLYLAQAGDQLVFASEIKAIFQHPGISRELDPEAVGQALTFWHPLSPRTAFSAVRELPPGHWLHVRAGKMEERAWWTVPYYAPEERWTGSFADACEEVVSLLQDAVKLRLRADVPVGAYLSGGLDSTILTALAAEEKGAQNLHSFSLSFREAAFDESAFQQEAANFIGTRHRVLALGGAEIREHFPAVVWHCEQPLLRTAPAPLYLLSRQVQEDGFKVVLTGEGADEVFGGYDIFKESKIRRFWAREPSSRRRPLLLERLYPYIFANPARGRRFLHDFYAVRAEDIDDPFLSHRLRWENGRRNLALLAPQWRASSAGRTPEEAIRDLLPSGFAGRDGLNQAQFLEFATFLSSFLLSAQGDRVAMAHSLEVRHPFLDARVIDFGCRLPAHWKIRGLDEKYILKQAFRRRIPESVRRRTKQPYRAPIREAFGHGTETLTDHVLSEASLRRGGIFDPARAGHLIARYRSSGAGLGNENQQMAVTAIASVQLLQHQFVEGRFLDPVLRQPDMLLENPGQSWRAKIAANRP